MFDDTVSAEDIDEAITYCLNMDVFATVERPDVSYIVARDGTYVLSNAMIVAADAARVGPSGVPGSLFIAEKARQRSARRRAVMYDGWLSG